MKTKGQAIVEFVMSLVIISLVLSCLITLHQFFHLKRRGLAVARMGAWLKATPGLSPDTARAEMEDYAQHLINSRLHPFQIDLGSFRETPASRFYKLVYGSVEIENPLVRSPLFRGVSGRPLKERVVIQTGQQEN